MASLKRVAIRGYRSIKSVATELRALNVLIGANGAGKSNFVSFFATSSAEDHCHEAVECLLRGANRARILLSSA